VIVVSNTSPMTNLAAIGQVALLRQLYGGVYIPEAVYRELRAGESRGDHPPFLEAADWIQVRAVPLETLQSLAPYRFVKTSVIEALLLLMVPPARRGNRVGALLAVPLAKRGEPYGEDNHGVYSFARRTE
jgi:hypothetical protein